MSYDLVVFAADVAPKEREAFVEWYKAQIGGDAGNDPAISTKKLQAWFADVIESYPPMNGPLSPPDLPEDETILTDYAIGKFIIYASFAWSKAEHAYETTRRLAEKHSTGLLNISSEWVDMWLPDASGHLVLMHRG